MNQVEAQVLAAFGAIVGVLLVAAIGYAANNFAKWTGIQLTDQQRKIIDDAANAIANALKIMIAQGKLSAHELHVANPDVQKVAVQHITPDVRHAMTGRSEGLDDLVRKSLAMVGNDHTAVALLAAPPRSTPVA